MSTRDISFDMYGRLRGANYFSGHSAKDFKKRLDDEFDFMVTPLVFDLALTLEAKGW